ncbi:Stimulator of interferon genes protein [Lamellibrachia satsuma]|nr:Stimulator of interferon genes protein [Lamellibrachia satsuma]
MHRGLSPKLIIVSPCSCYCPGSFTDVDENIVFDGHIPYKATRAGNIDRDYKSSVYRVTDPDTNEVYYAILEFTTPILSLYEMEAGAIAGLNSGQMDVQRKIFETKLQEILEHENNRRCNGRTILLSYTDEKYKGSGCQEVTRLSSIIVHCIRHELHKQTEAALLRLQIQEATEKLGRLDHGE